ncbi:Extracellular ribonuclease [Seminavis robusta]|uniref:Extracellular ribonuclease n=1 Tax=Seminavis robusta TaxID=568900 RepID=A0A9N8HT85_9STRA|nr:Extracellular ribonuclease [Seminavis robusta]|eukprot:Sro1481_g276250.1 Extracellular ribonuclease (572) ;mRNA; r:17722-19550
MKLLYKRCLQASVILLWSMRTANAYFKAHEDVTDLRFLDCDSSIYYDQLLAQISDPFQWTKLDLQMLTVRRHRGNVPAEAGQWGDDDIYQAVMDLDHGEEAGTVKMIYRNTSLTTKFKGFIWEIEHLWSTKEGGGINVTSAAYTDVHHVRAADIKVQEAKTTRHFGMCGTVSSLDNCVVPATSETSWDTARDDKIWQPPESKRGEIARALLYMDLRYQELKLGDCEPFATGHVGYLSQLLQWHTDYPPTEEEVRRNDRACTRWQGNRNPFVDYPDLALILHRSPQVPTTGCKPVNVTDGEETTSSESNTISDSGSNSGIISVMETKSPTFSPLPPPTTAAPTATPNACASIQEGNVPFFLVNTKNPDEVMFITLEGLEGGMELYLTDQAWDGRTLINNVLDEGTVMMTTPNQGIAAGTVFGYGLRANLGTRWTKVAGTFTLGLNGDNIFLYCLDNDNKIRFLSGFTNNYDWAPAFLDASDYGHNSSALPDSLVNSSIKLPHQYNYFYNGPRDARVNLLRRSILDPNEWEGSNDLRYSIDKPDEEEASSSSFVSWGSSFATLIVMLSWAFVN